MKIWSLETGQEIYSYHDNRDEVLCVVFSPDGQLLASCGGANDKMIKIIKLSENKVSNLIVNSDWFAGGINTLSFHPHGRILASADQNRNIQLWDVVRVIYHFMYIDFDVHGKCNRWVLNMQQVHQSCIA